MNSQHCYSGYKQLLKLGKKKKKIMLGHTKNVLFPKKPTLKNNIIFKREKNEATEQSRKKCAILKTKENSDPESI